MKVDEDVVFPVYIYESVLIKIFTLCKNSDNEIMGQLIGNVFKYGNDKYIIIKDLLYIEAAIYSHKYSTAMIEGTLVNNVCSPRARQTKTVRIGHPSGTISIEVEVAKTADGFHLKKAAFGRTSRRIMEGFVYVPEHLFEE